MATCYKLKATWKEPSSYGGLPQENISYDVCYGNDSMFTKAQKTVTLVMLIPGTEYSIRVRAKNTAGRSQYIMINGKTENRSRCMLYSIIRLQQQSIHSSCKCNSVQIITSGGNPDNMSDRCSFHLS